VSCVGKGQEGRMGGVEHARAPGNGGGDFFVGSGGRHARRETRVARKGSDQQAGRARGAAGTEPRGAPG
jgi:hypothetical protein